MYEEEDSDKCISFAFFQSWEYKGSESVMLLYD